MDRIDVICIGQALLDCIIRGQEADPHKENVFRAENITLSIGGDAINESFALAAYGHSVRLVCAAGDDLAGQIIMHEALRRRIDVSFAEVSKDLTTPVANLIVRRDGSRSSINSPAAKLSGYVPSASSVVGAKIVSFASLFRAPLDDPAVIRQLVRAAKESGALICADTKLPTWRDEKLSEIADVLPLIDYIFPNEKEAAYYSGIQGDRFADMAAVFHEYGVPNVIIKTGPKGCYASVKEGEFSLPPRDVPVVDTTGAGDNFVAGFLSGLLRGLSQRECLESALDGAAACVQHMGGIAQD